MRWVPVICKWAKRETAKVVPRLRVRLQPQLRRAVPGVADQDDCVSDPPASPLPMALMDGAELTGAVACPAVAAPAVAVAAFMDLAKALLAFEHLTPAYALPSMKGASQSGISSMGNFWGSVALTHLPKVS